MKTMVRTLAIVVAAAIFVWSGDANADPRANLRAQVAQARAKDPDAFRAVRDIVIRAGERAKSARGRRAPVALHLHALGPKALVPMLELIALDAPRDVPADALAASRLHVIEAVGLVRDPRALPVLALLLDEPNADFATARTVTEAIARMESDEAVRLVTNALAQARGDRARGIAAGMGSCHRLAIARALSDRLATSADEATRLAIVRSLGDVGNAWAWQTLALRSEEHATRALAARALVDAYVHSAGDLRAAASDALLVVDDATTPALASAARAGATRETNAALDELVRRLANNPTR